MENLLREKHWIIESTWENYIWHLLSDKFVQN
jgi:hypothetical protein